MYLKSIEVQGFKSFAKKLVFEFHNGITGIVGPNGSGKSNVADAVRWVLGEQSAKQLRGSSMQDVIFSGTEMRKPQSYAYVALTISNEDHKLNLPYEEVQVARRVYRSGESEYLLNGVTCRLRDVQELFFDTGIGKEGYSIIGQGQIDKILSGKPEERRELFDEAAGIVKFKKRKAAAEKNLETERQNLLRVQDILTELEKQVGPLEEQSKKAKEFLQLKEELKQFEVGLFCMDYETLQQETEEIEKNLSHTKEELEQAKADKEKSRSEYDSVESAIADFDRSVEKKKEKVNQDKLLITNFEGEIRITKEKISSAAQGKEYYKERTDALEESKQAANEELASYTASQKEALLELEKITDEEKSLSSQMEQLEKAILEDEIELNEQNEQIMDSMNASSKITVEQQKAKSMLEQNKIRKAELNQKILANKTQYSSAEEEMKREEELLKAAKKELDSAYVAKKELLRNADIKRQDILSLQKEQQEKQKNYHIIDSKLETVKNMAERYEGYSQSIRRVMEQKKPPIRMIAPGRVFRADEVDATHSPSFHQIEGMVIDKGITFSNLKGTLTQFVQKLFGKETKVKFRPHHFPFTEPSAEMDVSCFKCGGKGCRFCKGEGWIEILGCGMVHPRVLRMSGIDPEEYSGFAFGIGLERITLLKYEIDDMRLLYENDDRFLKQF